MVLKKIKVEIHLSEDAFKYLKTKFKSDEGEKVDAFFEDFVRLEMSIDIIKPKKETQNYRIIRKRTKELSDTGKELTSETLAEWSCGGYIRNVQMARDYLARMAKDGYVVLVRRDANGRKIYRWNTGKNIE